jgi:predicted porin
MKASPIAALLGLCCAGLAQAQSSVTVYGVLDAGLLSNSNGTHSWLLSPGNQVGNRLGFRGQEDLGGGLKAIFTIEHGFSIDTGVVGQGNTMWGREATVGLAGGFGTVKVGRQYDPLVTMMGGFTAANSSGHGSVPNWAGADGAHPGDVDNLGGSNRINNAVRYTTPDLSGFIGSAFYSFGEQTKFRSNSIWTVAATYGIGGLSLGAAYNDARDPNYSTWGDKASSLTATSTPSSLNMTGPVYSGFASARDYKAAVLAANYEVGPVTLGSVYSNVKFSDLGSVTGNGLNPLNLRGTAKFDVGEASIAWRIVPNFQVGGAYARTKGHAIGPVTGATYNGYELAAAYVMSPRTNLYLLAIRQTAGGIDSTGKPATAAVNNLTGSTNSRQTVFTVGIRHRF